MLSAASDIELWDSFIHGDQEALGALFKRYYPLLYQYGTKITPDKITLEDCIQELFTELWAKKTSRPDLSVKAYLLQALKYKLYKSFRDQKPVFRLNQDDDSHFQFSHETFLIAKQDDEEKTKRILDAINQLPSRQKEIIYLRIYKGLSYEEISAIMQINYQVVRNLLSQALKTFRKLILPAGLLLFILNH